MKIQIALSSNDESGTGLGMLSESGGFELGKTIKDFLNSNPLARRCLVDKDTADSNNSTVAKALYGFLRRHDFEANLVEGREFTKPLIDPGINISEKIDEKGTAAVQQDLSHGVVQVGGMIIDLTFLRLGSAYETSYSFLDVHFRSYWKHVKDVSKLANMTREDVSNILNATKPVYR